MKNTISPPQLPPFPSLTLILVTTMKAPINWTFAKLNTAASDINDPATPYSIVNLSSLRGKPVVLHLFDAG